MCTLLAWAYIRNPKFFLVSQTFLSLEYFGVLCIYDPIYITQFASAYLVVSIYDYMHWTICLKIFSRVYLWLALSHYIYIYYTICLYIFSRSSTYLVVYIYLIVVYICICFRVFEVDPLELSALQLWKVVMVGHGC